MKSTGLTWLQYRVIHNILPTKSFLYEIIYTESPACSFRQKDVETIDHLLCKYEHVKKIQNGSSEIASDWSTISKLYLKRLCLALR